MISFKGFLISLIPVLIIAGLWWTQSRPKVVIREIEPDWHNADNIGDGAAPWNGKVQAKWPSAKIAREVEPRGM